ncbi:Bestrophin, RFP-TM, chloride channel [Seminavis robusta]|uniref:Bestrophin, RFP-TM, chloride channel n=1 Tax=Seminavis robusta TaxID=568900 RepID=A0A9N8EL38_9STRA|nr:Bestrophin, RFP-TM, chloride channel [Seminavis robusta]|eukprot:Sro1263_g257270.1 Bestrophin, RFP-TM, chloride channel (370) ;mRNA; f:26271-27616
MTDSTRESAKGLWHILFELKGSIWSAVLPFCLLNCTIMLFVELLAMGDVRIAFSPSGHGLMTLIVSFLVINKVNLAYDRYMNSRHAIGCALSACRELNQVVLLYTHALPPSHKKASEWRQQTAVRILDMMDCTIRVVKNTRQANYLARNVDVEWKTDDDPLLHAQALRMHLYTINDQIVSNDQDNTVRLEMLERMRMMDALNEFVGSYRNLLKCASTPLPFTLVQMGRTFLFIWTFSIPLVLRGVVSEIYSAMVFVFFLTYGFVGLELVAMKLMNPFGDGRHDLNITGMKEAVAIGIEKDLRAFGEDAKLTDKRQAYSRQKARPPLQNNNNNMYAIVEATDSDPSPHQTAGNLLHSTGNSTENVYHPMH